MRKARYISGFALIAIGSLVDLFFSGTRGSGGYQGSLIPYPYLWGLAGIGVLYIGVRLVLSARMADVKEKETTVRNTNEDLVANGNVIVAGLDKCEVKTNNYSETLQVSTSAYGGIRDEEVTRDVLQSVLVYECEYRGVNTRFVSSLVHAQRETIMFKLAGQSTTKIYVDRDDPARYYFDISFLN